MEQIDGSLWFVIERVYNPREKRWRCKARCQCGTVRMIREDKARSGRWYSCGCVTFPYEKLPTWKRQLYQIWRGIISRCRNPKDPNFSRYGARGIDVAEEWATDLNAFCEAVGPRPSRRHSIDRIDNDGPYAPGNVRWATANEQATNTRTNHRITAGGRTMAISEWARELGVHNTVVHSRLRKGWSEEEAVLTPVRAWKNYRGCRHDGDVPGLSCATIIRVNGQTRTIKWWAATLGCRVETVITRIRRGWPLELAVTIPVKPLRNERVKAAG